MDRYKALTRALKILECARFEVFREEGNSPAWDKLYNAWFYVKKQAHRENERGGRVNVHGKPNPPA